MTRTELVARINAAQAELQNAGKIHKRDLHKHIKRMERELRDYDRFHEKAVS